MKRKQEQQRTFLTKTSKLAFFSGNEKEFSQPWNSYSSIENKSASWKLKEGKRIVNQSSKHVNWVQRKHKTLTLGVVPKPKTKIKVRRGKKGHGHIRLLSKTLVDHGFEPKSSLLI